jgi:hypothetical protein
MRALRNGDVTQDLQRASTSHQLLRRGVNEQIKKLNDGYHVIERIDVFCECGRNECSERLSMEVADYERVRRFPTRFLVLEGHDVLESERVVDESKGFVVVEKTGSEGVYAVHLDPRRQTYDA